MEAEFEAELEDLHNMRGSGYFDGWMIFCGSEGWCGREGYGAVRRTPELEWRV